jgi:IS66 C-terminal element
MMDASRSTAIRSNAASSRSGWERKTICSQAVRAAPKPGPLSHRLINSAKLHDIDPRHYLTDLLERIVSGRTKINQLNTLLPWNWKAERDGSEAKRAA